MSAFVVIFHRDGSPIDAEALNDMSRQLVGRGPDGSRELGRDPFALAHQHFWVTPEEIGERQPLSDPSGHRLLVFDGRLDNRQELVAALELDRSEGHSRSDAELALAAYLRWGDALCEHLLGPFALVICDLVERRVLCARDPLGDRTLFYRLDGRRLLIASEESALLVHPEVSDRLDRRRLAAYFALQVPADGSSFFLDITELRPGELLQVTETTSRCSTYWQPVRALAEVRRCDAELADEFRELLREAVRCRLRSTGPPAVMMSGGLDSTSIAALAAEELQQAAAPWSLRAVSWVFDDLTECDERQLIEPVVSRWGLEALQFCADHAWPAVDDPCLAANPNAPEENAYRRLKGLAYSRASSAGSRVVLNGGSADVLYTGGNRWFGDLWREGRGRQAMADLMAEVRQRGLVLAMRRAGAGRWARSLGVRGGRTGNAAPDWLTTAARGWLSGPHDDGERPPKGLRPDQLRAVTGMRPARDISVEIYHANRHGVDLRHPYRDRRLVEFALRLPAHQLYRQGRRKHIARQAMAGRLPRPILDRAQPTRLTPLFERGVRDRDRAAVEELLRREDSRWPEFVRRRWMERQLCDVRGGLGEAVLWNCLSFEIWRRRHRSTAVVSDRSVS